MLEYNDMNNLTLRIVIDKPASDILSFVLNPNNTHLWINSFVKEETNEWPVKVGTIYKNVNIKGEWGEVRLIDLHKHGFEMATLDDVYHVRYTLTPLSANQTEFEYYEWVNTGSLDAPFELSHLHKLKSILED